MHGQIRNRRRTVRKSRRCRQPKNLSPMRRRASASITSKLHCVIDRASEGTIEKFMFAPRA